MTKQTVKQASILGLVLVAASAVTAAMMPNKSKNNSNQNAQGTLTASTNGGLTCKLQAGANTPCFATATDTDAADAFGTKAATNVFKDGDTPDTYTAYPTIGIASISDDSATGNNGNTTTTDGQKLGLPDTHN